MSGEIRPAPMPLAGVLARWDALAIRWGLDGEERSGLLGERIEGPIDDESTYDIPGAERRMRLLVELEPVVAAVLVDEGRTREWLRRPNRQLGDRAPIDVMSRSPEWIRWLIDSLGIAT